jgi:5-methylcytosine-specific restriction protein A
MPMKPRSRCPRCKRLHDGTGTCAQCKAAADNRLSAARRGYGARHRDKFRIGVLDRDPVCVLCHRAPSTHADHYPRGRRELVALGLDPDDPRYGRGLCASCDSRQTAQRQPGGFNERSQG